jgi:cardiolipin synthase
MRDFLVSALDGSRETARLTSAYFAPDRGVLESLERAAERGVRVEIILAGRCDHPLLRRGARSTVERLLRRGVSVHEYAAGILHAKSAVFDGRLAVVGTSNLDRQSLQHSYEVNLLLASPGVAGQIDRLFEADLARSAEITLETLARRGLVDRAFDRLAAAAVQAFV